jgi:hypothetical protein
MEDKETRSVMEESYKRKGKQVQEYDISKFRNMTYLDINNFLHRDAPLCEYCSVL